MELFRCVLDGVEVYACRLELSGREAERCAVRKLVGMAFEGGEVPEIGHRKSGEPFLEGCAAAFSVTHCHGAAVIALKRDGGRVGVDAESASRMEQLRRVAGRFLSDVQHREWGACGATLLRAWTVKEALYKAAGVPGLPLQEIPLPATAAVPAAGGMGDVALRGRSFRLYQVDLPWFNGDVTLAVENFTEG